MQQFIPHQVTHFKKTLEGLFSQKTELKTLLETNIDLAYKYCCLLYVHDQHSLEESLSSAFKEMFDSMYLKSVLESLEKYSQVLEIEPSGKYYYLVYSKVKEVIEDREGLTGIIEYINNQVKNQTKPKGVADLFMLFEDKVLLEKSYHKCALQRAIEGTNLSIEAQVCEELKDTIGSECIENTESLIKDINETMQLDPCFNCLVISQKSWSPLVNPYPEVKSVLDFIPNELPKDLVYLIDQYQKAYLASYPNRQLKWIFLVSTAELRYFQTLIKCSFLQALILLLFNASNEVPREEVKQKVQTSILPDSVIEKELQALSPVLKCKNNNYFVEKVEESFLNLVPNNSTPTQEISKSLDKDRAPVVQAKIVLMLKQTKQLSFKELLSKTTTSLGFPVTEDLFRAQLKNLVEREYITELEDNYWYI